MTEITKYLADDGKEFDDEDECLEYERRQKAKDFYGFKCYDKNGNPLDFRKYLGDMDEFAWDVKCVKVDDIKGWNDFENFCKDDCDVYFDNGLDDICEKGLYYYDEDHDYWENWEHEYEKLRIIRKKYDF